MVAVRPWSEIVLLHPDVESGETALAAYALDLGAVVAGDPNVPVVYRDARSFWRATYLTSGMNRLLEEVLGRLAGRPGDRVLQLRSPFGGGKSHTLAALYYAIKNRDQMLASVPEAEKLADPGLVRVAVFDGEKFDALEGKEVDGQRISTLWGWLAWQLGEYELVREHDEKKVAPGGDLVKKVLGDTPTLLLLDEVLKYVERAEGVKVGNSTLGSQTLEFVHTLSVEVAGTRQAVLAYSLQASARESYGREDLLRMLDHLTARVDARREPVGGDEILPVLKKRLVAETPSTEAVDAVANGYGDVIRRALTARAGDEDQRREVDERSLQLARRLREAYPFHPALIDIMKERWASIPEFGRTRGALRFLAICLHALKESGKARDLLGASDIPLEDVGVRYAFFTEVGQREPFVPVLEADFIGPNARAKQIDVRLARENPSLSGVLPATRLATAILLYSFGGPPRESAEAGETLPPGVTENEILEACLSPELDGITIQAVLKELREKCLYLHYDGVRYIFKTTPNVTKLIEDEAEYFDSHPDAVLERIKEELERRLGGRREVVLWPVRSLDIPDEGTRFLLAYLPLEFVEKPNLEPRALEFLTQHGDRPRRYRNALGLAIPDQRQLQPLRRAVRYLLAIESVELKKRQLGVTREQAEQLKERKDTELAALESALRSLYTAVWLLKMEDSEIALDKVAIGGRPLQAQGIHERIMELLTTVQTRLFASLAPRRVVELLKVDEKRGIAGKDVRDAFFGIPGCPRLTDEGVLKRTILRGVEEGIFGYVGRPDKVREEEGLYVVDSEYAVSGRSLSEEEVDLGSGFLMLPTAIKGREGEVFTPVLDSVPPQTSGKTITVSGTAPAGCLIIVSGGKEDVRCWMGEGETRFGVQVPLRPNEMNTLNVMAQDSDGRSSMPATIQIWQGKGRPPSETLYRRSMTLNRAQLYQVFNAFGNLAEKAGRIRLTVEAEKADGFDPNWLRNAVEEPLEEAGIEEEPE